MGKFLKTNGKKCTGSGRTEVFRFWQNRSVDLYSMNVVDLQFDFFIKDRVRISYSYYNIHCYANT